MDSQHTFDLPDGVMYKLGSIEAELRAINEKLDKKEAAQDEEIKTLKADVAALKMWRVATMAAASVVSFIIGVGVKFIPWQNLTS